MTEPGPEMTLDQKRDTMALIWRVRGRTRSQRPGRMTRRRRPA